MYLYIDGLVKRHFYKNGIDNFKLLHIKKILFSDFLQYHHILVNLYYARLNLKIWDSNSLIQEHCPPLDTPLDIINTWILIIN